MSEPMPPPPPATPAERHLAATVMEIESHAAEAGWDQPGRLFALVETTDLVEHEPELVDALGLSADAPAGALTPIEQDHVTADRPLEELLETISWPTAVCGCAAVVERLVLPPEADDDIPDQVAEAAEFAHSHPLRQEVRIVAAATRAGTTYCALRLRSHDDERSVVGGSDLVPGLLELLVGTLAESPGVESM